MRQSKMKTKRAEEAARDQVMDIDSMVDGLL